MENRKLNDNELEQVNGGQAVLPLLSRGINNEDRQILVTGCNDSQNAENAALPGVQQTPGNENK